MKSGNTTIATIDVTDTSQVTFTGSTVTINPSNDLSNGTNYSIIVASGVIKDNAGNNWSGSGNNPFDFTTITGSDVTAPTIVIFDPVDGATGIALDKNIVITFNEPIKFGSGSFYLREGSQTGKIIDSTCTWSSSTPNIIILDPTANLKENTKYFFVLNAGSIIDDAGNTFAGTNTYDFTTVAPSDTAAPTLLSITPTDGATGIAVNANFVLTFNENVKAGTGSFLVKSGNTTIATIDVTDTSQVTFNGSTVTINPSNDLRYDTSYSVSVASDVITDIAGNNWGGSGTNSYDFVTQKQTATPLADFLQAPNSLPWIMNGLAGNDTLIGGEGNDILTGGAGEDVLLGEDGDDIFIVVTASDMPSGETVTGGAGTDELRFAATAKSTLSIGSSVSVEKIVIGTGTAAAAVATGTVALNVDASSAARGLIIIGNAGANILTGSVYDDILQGGAGNDTISAGIGDDVITGGLGTDVLNGGTGLDSFIFNSTLGKTNIDVIQDFNVVDDVIYLENTGIFSAITLTGALASSAFNIGTKGTEADDRIIYDSATGKLFYDADGSGKVAAVQFATLSSGLTLTHSDFWVI